MNEVIVELTSGRQNTLFSRELRDSLFSLLKRWLREPLLHFLLIGSALLGVYTYSIAVVAELSRPIRLF